MSEIDSGGNAFPAQVGFYSVPLDHINCDCVKRIGERILPGMTKREWYAGMALGAVYTSYMEYSEKHGMDENWRDGIAGDAFKMADSMIRAGKGEK